MATYKQQYTSGSATSTADLGDPAMGIRNDTLANINPTNLAYGFYSVDQAGRIACGAFNRDATELQPLQVSGTNGNLGLIVTFPTGGNVLGVTASAVTASAESYQMTVPWVVSGNVSATQVGVWGVTSSAMTANQGTNPWTVSGNVSATQVGVWGVTSSAVTASAEVYQATNPWTISGNVSATQVGIWGVTSSAATAYVITQSATATLASGAQYIGQASAFQTGTWVVTAQSSATTATLASGTQHIGNVSAEQSTNPWTVSGNVSATQVGIWGVTSSAMTANQGTNPWTVSGNVSATQVGSPWGVSGTVTVSGGAAGAQYTSGSATAANDLGTLGLGIRNDATAQVNPTDLAYGVYSVDASGRVFVRAHQFGIWGVTSSATTANQGTNPWTVSGNVSATQVTNPWVVSGNVSATQVTSPWVVSLATTTAFISGTATVIPSTSTGVSADGLAGANSQIVASFNYIKTSGADTWQRWQSVPSGGTASGVGTGIPMTAPLYQRFDTPTSPADTFFGVPRIDANRNTIVTASAVWPVVATAVWGVSGSVTAGQTAALGVSGSVTVLATALTAVPASSTALTADRIGAVSGQTVAGFAYVKASGADTWDRWVGVPSGATGSAVSGVPVVAPFWQFDDSSTVTVGENFFGVPRMSSARIAYVTSTAALTFQASANLGISGSAAVQGIAAHDASTNNNPVRIGLKATQFVTGFSTASNITASDGNTVSWYATRTGIPFMLGGGPDMQTVWIQPTAVSSNAKLIAGAAGSKIVVLGAGVTLASTATTGVAFRMAFPSASGASTLDAVATSTAGNLTANIPIISHANIPAGGGITRGDGGGIVAVGYDGMPVFATWTAPTNGSLDIWISYIKVPS